MKLTLVHAFADEASVTDQRRELAAGSSYDGSGTNAPDGVSNCTNICTHCFGSQFAVEPQLLPPHSHYVSTCHLRRCTGLQGDLQEHQLQEC